MKTCYEVKKSLQPLAAKCSTGCRNTTTSTFGLNVTDVTDEDDEVLRQPGWEYEEEEEVDTEYRLRRKQGGFVFFVSKQGSEHTFVG